MQVATIVTRRELARARALGASVAQHLPGASTLALVLDASDDQLDSGEPLELLTPAAAGLDELPQLAAVLTLEELREACKPVLLSHLIGRDGAQAILYLDADSLILGALDDVEALAAAHGVVVKTRATRPIPDDGRRPNEADLQAWGLHDSGFLALGAGHDHRALLEWWSDRVPAASGEDAGAPPLERIATLGAGAHEIGDLGVGLSFWDLQGRALEANGAGLTVDGARVRLMRFPAFDPAAPERISSAQDRIRAGEMPALGALCERYAQTLAEAGEAAAAQLPYGFATLPDGTRLDHRLRTIYHEGVEQADLPSPFTPAGLERFYAWLAEPASVGSRFGLNRLCMLVRDHHPELRDAYPDLDRGEDAYGMIEWIREHGVREGTLPEAVVPSSAPEYQEAERRSRARRGHFGLNVVGYFTSEMGLGEGHRLVVTALDAAEVPLLPMLPPTLPPSRADHPYATVPLSAAGFPLNLIAINGDGMARFRDQAGSGFFRHHHNVGLWWWEVDTLPADWLPGFELLDEVWVGSEHVAHALTAVAPIPVHKIRFPIVRPSVDAAQRPDLGAPAPWTFLSMFDHNSVIDRKNPLGSIAAFTRAFEPDSGAVLVLKSINSEGDPAGRERIRAAVAEHPHIRLLETQLSRAQTDALIDACDCVVSLHRAEGFGHVIAEAMALGKPVIATAYSGNLDFMTAENSYPVDYTLREVGPGCWPYPEDAQWAEPDLDCAARLMREVFADPAAARARGGLAAAGLARTHSPLAAGLSMRARAEYVFERWEGEPYQAPLKSELNITAGGRGQLLRKVIPGVIVRIERELDRLWEADDQRKFDLYEASRGPLLTTLAATLATLRRVEGAAAGRDRADARPRD